MKEYLFISGRLRFRNRVVTASVALSYIVMIVAVAVSAGFRKEIRDGLSLMAGDIQITSPHQNVLDSSNPIEKEPSYLSNIESLAAVQKVEPVVYKAGIVKADDNIHGVMFKGMASGTDSVSLAVSIPRRLSEITGLKPGDKMLSYFVGEKTKVRQFNVVSIYESIIQTDDMLVVYAQLDDLQRIDGWTENQVSCMEVFLDSESADEQSILSTTETISGIIYDYSMDSESPVVATATISRYSQLYDWLDLIDFNVLFVIILMVVVAGFNMISCMLIMLFENISTIGVFKALGMTDWQVSRIFMIKAASFLLKAMFIGNILAIGFCILQGQTHLIKLDPENYFVSFVPVNIDLGAVLIADMLSFVVIMLILLLSVMFIAKVNPADTVKMK